MLRRFPWILLVIVSALCPRVVAQAGAAPREVRALWVTRFDYKSPDDVKKIIENAAALNFNVILFQVRGNGTVFYPSKIEPWAFELTGETPATVGKDPGWDPLKLAIQEARSRGGEVHASVN